MSRLFTEAAATTGLATEQNAIRRFAPFAELIEQENIDHFVLVCHGRYFPVVRLRDGQRHLMHSFLNNKIGVM